MADKTIRMYNRGGSEYIDVLYHDNGDGTYSPTTTLNVANVVIGDVDIASIAAGDNNIGNVDLASPLPAGSNNIGKVESVLIIPDADITQLVTITTAGTPVQGPNKTNPSGWWMRIDPANTGIVYVMFHGQTKATKGFPLDTTQPLIPIEVSNLQDLDFDTSVNAQKIWFLKA